MVFMLNMLKKKMKSSLLYCLKDLQQNLEFDDLTLFRRGWHVQGHCCKFVLVALSGGRSPQSLGFDFYF